MELIGSRVRVNRLGLEPIVNFNRCGSCGVVHRGVRIGGIVEAIGDLRLGGVRANGKELSTAILAVPGKVEWRAGGCRPLEGPDHLARLEGGAGSNRYLHRQLGNAACGGEDKIGRA